MKLEGGRNDMDTSVIDECSRLSFEGTPFPEIVKRLSAAGVRSYDADLVRLQKVYYGGDREAYGAALSLTAAPSVADDFDEERVVAPLRAIQRGEIGYAEFLRRIMRAGCSSYSVFIRGRKAIYFGKDGQLYVENFPQPTS